MQGVAQHGGAGDLCEQLFWGIAVWKGLGCLAV